MTQQADQASDRFEAELAALAAGNIDTLRNTWRRLYGPPPRLKSADLLRRLLAWRMQADRFGGLTREDKASLKRTGRSRKRGETLGLGAVLRREWRGEIIEAVVEADGFRCRNTLYPSLSAAASDITGTRWNGARFFGLDDHEVR